MIFVDDHKQGYAGFELQAESADVTRIAGRILYWDATGGFCFETVGGDLPVEIVEAAI